MYFEEKYKLDFVEPHILFVYVSIIVAEVKLKVATPTIPAKMQK